MKWLSVRWINKSPSLHTTIKVASPAALPCSFNLAIDTLKHPPRHVFNLTSVTGRDSISLAVTAWYCDPALFDSPAEIVLTATINPTVITWTVVGPPGAKPKTAVSASPARPAFSPVPQVHESPLSLCPFNVEGTAAASAAVPS